MPDQFEVKRNRTDKHPIKISFDFGSNLAAAQAMFDGPTKLDSVVFDLFKNGAKQQLTNFVQKLLDGEDPETKKPYLPQKINSLVEDWKPTTNRRAKANVSRVVSAIADLSPEEKAVLRAKLAEED
jgi:hypothetical protein